MVPDDEFEPFSDMLDGDEDGASVPVYGWRVLMFMDPNGTEWFKWQSFGSPAIGTSIGVMELVKHKMLNAHDVVDTIARLSDIDDIDEELEHLQDETDD
jgi:hypothetical protein